MVTRTPACPPGGHSLPELIVAMTFLAATLVAVAGTAVLAEQRSGRAVATQRATRLAAATLDSVARIGGVTAGSRSEAGLTLVWGPIGDRIRVTVVDPAGVTVVALVGDPVPDVPVLPDERPGPAGGGP
ncbi:MAG: hypothetical protein R3314_07165 [Longimicrobiales bacterium]|nr:hypothetical protein [Longimicrobiales bacterium]